MTLPEDCIREILEHFSEDKKSLYSCLFTNRFFCKCIIPILWRNPWSIISLLVDNDIRIDKTIVKTIIKCFPQEIKQSLLKQQIYLNSSLLKQPLFNYVSYIQEISPLVIDHLTETILNELDDYNICNDNFEQIDQMFTQEFWSLFMKQCFRIKYLQMPSFNLLEYPGSNNSLSSLSTLKINTYLREMIVEIIELSKSIHTLKRIEMDVFRESSNEIETLILSQNNLREILFISYVNQFSFNNGKTIEHLSQSLRILEFIGCVCLSAQAITSFINLTELKIDFGGYRYNNIDIEKLKQILLPKLGILSLISASGKDLTSYTKLIESTKGSLKILNIDLIYLSQVSLSSIEFYLRTIQTTCPNIEVLPIWLFSGISLIDFENLLITCSKIRKIIIHVITSNLNFQVDTVLAKPVLYLLAIKSSSIFLNDIYLIGRWSFSNLDLLEFFELWKEKERKPLTFSFDNNIYSNYIIKVCEFYRKQGVVKSGSTINYTSPCAYY